MIDMADAEILAIYDFEGAIENAVANVFSAAGFNVVTGTGGYYAPFERVGAESDFQHIRPRTELVFRVNGATSPERSAIMADGSLRNSAWNGELAVVSITDPSAPGKAVHAVYRSKVRNLLSQLGSHVNETFLPCHKIQRILEGSTSLVYTTEDGYEQSTISFLVQFSVQADKWAGIET